MERDLTTGRPLTRILWFSIPIFIGNIFQQFYNLADTMIVGQLLGMKELAAVGSTGSLMFIVLGFAQGLGAGFSIITAQHFGSGNHQKVKQSFATSIVLSTLMTIVITLLCVVFTRPLLELMQTPPDIIDFAYEYLQMIFIGTLASVLFNLLGNMLRALGDSRTPLYFLVFACLLNVFLDWFLIRVIPLGVRGAAVATVVAQLVTAVACLIYIRRRFVPLQVHRTDFHFDRLEYERHLRLGVAMGFQYSIIGMGQVALQYSLNQLGTVAVAAYTAAGKIEFFSSMPVQALGTSLATFAGQNLGAGKTARIKSALKQVLAISLAISVVMGAVNLLFGEAMISLFVKGTETEMMALGQQVLTANGLSYWLLAILFICRFTLQGLGQSLVPTISGIMELISRFLAAFLLSQQFGFFGITLANPLAWLLAAIPLAVACYLTLRKLPDEEEPLS